MLRPGWRELLGLGRVIAAGKMMHEAGDPRSFTSRFERALERKMGVRSATTVNSGTSGLVIALAAAGIGPGDEVLVPAYTWVSTAIAPIAVGATPILVDVDESLTIDPLDAERKTTSRTKAIIPVHMLNLVCDMAAVQQVARANNILIIEDACQAVGVTYHDRRVGSIGHFGVFSFNHYKNMSAGEGGAVLTNDDALAQRVRVFHDIGSYSADFSRNGDLPIGQNYRVSELTSSVLLAQLKRLDRSLDKLRARRRKAVRSLKLGSTARLSPHHDPKSAVGLTLLFDDAAQAAAYAARHCRASRIIDIGRHDYLSWLPVLQSYAGRAHGRSSAIEPRPTYCADMCRRTLDILSRSCLIDLR